MDHPFTHHNVNSWKMGNWKSKPEARNRTGRGGGGGGGGGGASYSSVTTVALIAGKQEHEMSVFSP